ncbi:hypothetical protein [Marinithermus hydrothermalis]|uniref:Uncharacterized protein n=1 Tax=Marinithermus hydrothermalis (strain DSM 14884 / JCM 11576 / T1) TaxID=869210 RepID=F2NLS7_MARHT|nr:hypothetical protein [Marinithermus hydrothermalis]AEB10907.1 hypothetical protein Marky_0144 [Marinithermus hydrothermalis DSM 14884]
MRWGWLLLALWWASPAGAQTLYYYEYPLRVAPAALEYRPTEQLLFCSAITQPPGPLPSGGVTLKNLPAAFAAGCPLDAPPVVVWGEDPASGQVAYALEVSGRFWGMEGPGQRTTPDDLIALLEQAYALRVLGEGGGAAPRLEIAPQLRTPPYAPGAADAWTALEPVQLVGFATPEQRAYRRYRPRDGICQLISGGRYRRCWSVTFVWHLPVRLVLTGGEAGRFTLRLGVDTIEQRARAATLSARGGRLEAPRLEPVPFPLP